MKTFYEVSSVILWILIALNVWCAWRNWKMSNVWKMDCMRMNLARADMQEAENEYIEERKRLAALRERLESDDRNEDEAQGRAAD